MVVEVASVGVVVGVVAATVAEASISGCVYGCVSCCLRWEGLRAAVWEWVRKRQWIL